jgi:hypothetical protein
MCFECLTLSWWCHWSIFCELSNSTVGRELVKHFMEIIDLLTQRATVGGDSSTYMLHLSMLWPVVSFFRIYSSWDLEWTLTTASDRWLFPVLNSGYKLVSRYSCALVHLLSLSLAETVKGRNNSFHWCREREWFSLVGTHIILFLDYYDLFYQYGSEGGDKHATYSQLNEVYVTVFN